MCVFVRDAEREIFVFFFGANKIDRCSRKGTGVHLDVPRVRDFMNPRDCVTV